MLTNTKDLFTNFNSFSFRRWCTASIRVDEEFHLGKSGTCGNFVKRRQPSWHGCISHLSLTRLMQRLRDISKRADLQISETSPVRFIKDVSSEMSLRPLRSSQRRLWVASETEIRYFQTETFFGYLLINLRVFKYFANLI